MEVSDSTEALRYSSILSICSTVHDMQALRFHGNDRFRYCVVPAEIMEPKNRSPRTSSALPIKINLLKVFPCSNSQEVQKFL